MEATVQKCSCKHEWQDGRYGVGFRLFNPMAIAAKGGTQKLRCTVCNVVVDLKKAANA